MLSFSTRHKLLCALPCKWVCLLWKSAHTHFCLLSVPEEDTEDDAEPSEQFETAEKVTGGLVGDIT